MEMRHLLLAIAVGSSMATHNSPPLAHFNGLAISYSIWILLPPYLSFHSIHVIVRYLKLSHQQIHPKIIGGGLPVSRHCAVYE